MVSRSLALVHKEFECLHRKDPFSLFLVIKHPQLAADLQNRPTCLRDPFAAEFLKHNSLAEPAAQQKLLLQAKLLGLHIADIECKHASMRKLLLRIQSRPTEFLDLASDWVAQRHRRRKVTTLSEHAPSKNTVRRRGAQSSSRAMLKAARGHEL